MGASGRSPPSICALEDQKMRHKYSISLEDSSMVTKHKLQLSDPLFLTLATRLTLYPGRS